MAGVSSLACPAMPIQVGPPHVRSQVQPPPSTRTGRGGLHLKQLFFVQQSYWQLPPPHTVPAAWWAHRHPSLACVIRRNGWRCGPGLRPVWGIVLELCTIQRRADAHVAFVFIFLISAPLQP